MIQIVVAVSATALVLGWIWILTRYGEGYTELIAGIDREIYRMPELFYVGFGIMDLVHFNMHSKRARKKIHEIGEINGKKYAEYYFYVTTGAQFTYAYLVLLFFFLFAAVSVNVLIAGIGMFLAVMVVMYYEQMLGNQLSDRRDALLSEFPQVLSKLALLVNCGMVMRDAWEKVSKTGDGILYQEMKITMEEFHNGVSELMAYRNFAERCGLKEIRRFSSTMIQNLNKGNEEIAYFLRELSTEMWEEKKHLAKRKGEAANSKLMIPTGLIFIGILVMIMVPAFSGM